MLQKSKLKHKFRDEAMVVLVIKYLREYTTYVTPVSYV
jgi:hypothetical protein